MSADLSHIPETKQLPMPNSALRHDQGKVRFSDADRYVDPWFLEAIGDAMAYGARKYGHDNWRKGMNWSRCLNSARRHLFAWWREGPIDQESGCHHLALATCSLMFLFAYERESLGKDDRK